MSSIAPLLACLNAMLLMLLLHATPTCVLSTVVTSSGWQTQKEVSAREGLIAIAYERRHGEHSRIYQVGTALLQLHLFALTTIGEAGRVPVMYKSSLGRPHQEVHLIAPCLGQNAAFISHNIGSRLTRKDRGLGMGFS